MNQLSIKDEAVLTEIDDDLAEMEDRIKGPNGDIIIEIRGLIQKLIFNE